MKTWSGKTTTDEAVTQKITSDVVSGNVKDMQRLILAGHAVTGLTGQPPQPGYTMTAEVLAHRAVQIADAVLAQLDKK